MCLFERGKNFFRNLMTVFLVWCFVFPIFSPIAYSAGNDTSQRVIRIGCIDYEGFFDKQPDGSYAGYGVDYLQEISQYTNWKYEYVYGEWADLMNKVKNGEIDFICHAQRTPQREQDYLFSKYSDGAEANVLYVRLDDDRYYYNDFKHFNGMRIGVLKNSYQNSVFAEYAGKKKFQYTTVEYDTTGECFDALKNGEIDAAAMGSLAMRTDFKIVCRFGSDPFYFITGKMNGEIKDELDDALGQIAGTKPFFQAEKYDKYYGSKMTKNILFTREETEYIANHGVINVGLLSKVAPLSYRNNKGEAAGIVVDLMNLISERSGIKFNYNFLDDGETADVYLDRSDSKLVAGVVFSEFYQPNDKLIMSDNMDEQSIVFVGKRNTEFDIEKPQTLVVSGYLAGKTEAIQKKYPNYKIIKTATSQEALKQVMSGQADVTLQNEFVIRNIMRSPVYSDLEIYPAYAIPNTLRVVAHPEDRLLVSIVNKTLSSMSAEDKNKIIINHTVANSYRSTLQDLMHVYKYPLIGILILLVICIAMVVLNMVNKQRNLRELNAKNAQLDKAVEQASTANVAKSQFLAKMSHEIRTPLNAIIGYLDIALDKDSDASKVKHCLENSQEASVHLLDIINDILDMSAIESGRMKIAHEDFDLKRLLTEMTSVFYQNAKMKKILFKTQLNDFTEEWVIGDQLRLKEILMNLLSNALKFTPADGSVTFSIHQLRNDANQVYLQFIVEDNGIGMSEEYLSRLFTSFEQENASTARKYGGSGLGLAITHNLILLMGGSVEVASKKGEGTCFKVTIPFDKSLEHPIMNTDKVDYSHVKVLIVDDQESDCTYLHTLLHRCGVHADTVNSGKAALELIKEHQHVGEQYDLCIMDWSMPELNGIETARQIRALVGNEIILIIATAYDLSEISEEAFSAGVNRTVPKPLFQSTMMDLLVSNFGEYKPEGNDEESISTMLQGMKVLVAEDNEMNMEILNAVLERAGVVAEPAENGLIAYEKFVASEPGTYKMILMDIQMPILDGYNATRKIRASEHPEAKTIPIIALTANAFAEDIAESLSCGMNAHLAKPINYNKLYETITRYAK